MERKFESELGKHVAEGSWKKSSKKAAALAVTLSTCALMVSSAAFLLPAMAGEELGKPVYWENVIEAQNDYLVYEEEALVLHAEDEMDVDELFDVKRTITVKAAVFDPPSGNSGAEYNKFVYSVNVNLRDLAVFSPGGTVVGVLEIPYTGDSELTVSWSMTVDDVLVSSSDDEVPAYVPADWGVEEGVMITASVTLPEGYVYVEGSQISIQVMLKVPWYSDIPLPDDEVIVETPFPDSADS